MATPVAIPPLLAAWAAAWSAHNPDRLLALYTADAVYEEVPTNTVVRGTDAIRAFAAFNFAAFADIEVRPETGVQAEGWAALQAVFAGRYTGQAPGLTPGSGQSFALRFATVFELDGGTIRRSTVYFDSYAFLVQIGVLPTTAGLAGMVTDLVSLVTALRGDGRDVEEGGPLTPTVPFARAQTGTTLRLSGDELSGPADIQAYEYADAAAAAQDASRILPDGISQSTMVKGGGSPHFFRQGRLIALYVGNDPAVLRLLTALLGSPFAAL